ncbi:uncharacterized protein PGTG_04945 [Puccinia graminis f. sp. tritici CRL 75-36-700-3]|uniref:Uncharacterized protein n=2 Tax=Puccinia graminis f. sp. tritici TaxID=56615 RepID=E3K3D2_PUCGT|nr:uncharacterized protein PGTG_04945 [Puccinia graminis f. sp. tritici CRL 75-36-700-3]EFP78989.2 hypothetical protein PGTG_04945 [Puccinia graminis f. sp. tritici CRL 75-36-700-3]
MKKTLIRSPATDSQNSKGKDMAQFIFGSLTILLSLLQLRVSAYEVTLDPPINSNNTIQKFTLQRKLSWTNQDFVLYKQNSTAPIIKIENHMANQFTGFFGLDLTFPDGRYLDVKANAGQVVCGFRQIYEISDGVRFRIDPRGIHSDRWKIDKSGNLTANYTWYRNVRRLAGVIKSDNNRKVACFNATTFGSKAMSGIFHSRWPGLSNYTISTNGDVPIEVLASLYATAIVRRDKCGW